MNSQLRQYQALASIEAITNTQHQIIRILELVQLITHMQECTFGDMGFQSEYLIELIGIGSFTNKVLTNTHIDGKNRHYNLPS